MLLTHLFAFELRTDINCKTVFASACVNWRNDTAAHSFPHQHTAVFQPFFHFIAAKSGQNHPPPRSQTFSSTCQMLPTPLPTPLNPTTVLVYKWCQMILEESVNIARHVLDTVTENWGGKKIEVAKVFNVTQLLE